MNKAISLSAGILLLTSAIAQQKPEHNAVWSVAVSSFTSSMPGATYTKAVFTPVRPIVVRRIEAFGERGPLVVSALNTPPKPCPVQFSLQISNGATTQVVPISGKFVKDAPETYTDSGPLNLALGLELL